MLSPDQMIEIHHIKPKKLGGSDKLSNLIALHQQCHRVVTHTKDIRLKAQFEKTGILDDLFGE
jgi:5-methylcytosine-specific restriction endonuclease McrA